MVKIILNNGNEYIANLEMNELLDILKHSEEQFFTVDTLCFLSENKPYFIDGKPVFNEYKIAVNKDFISEYSIY